MKGILAVFVVAFGCASGFAADVPSVVADVDLARLARTQMEDGIRLREDVAAARPRFRQAAHYLDELRRRGAHNPTLYRFLGNAWLLSDDLPRAILNYRRGLALAPDDPELHRALAEARSQVVYPQGSAVGRRAAENRPPWLPHIPSLWVAGGALLAYLVACLLLTRWLMVRRAQLLIFGLLLVASAAAISCLLIYLVQDEKGRASYPLVVIAEDGVLLRRGDGFTWPARSTVPLNRGVEAHLLFERDDWLQIELSSGDVGWVPRSQTVVDDS